MSRRIPIMNTLFDKGNRLPTTTVGPQRRTNTKSHAAAASSAWWFSVTTLLGVVVAVMLVVTRMTRAPMMYMREYNSTNENRVTTVPNSVNAQQQSQPSLPMSRDNDSERKDTTVNDIVVTAGAAPHSTVNDEQQVEREQYSKVKKSPAEWEREARAEQEAFCQTWHAEQQQKGNSGQQPIAPPAGWPNIVTASIDPTATKHDFQPFDMRVYVSQDIVSKDIRRGGWDLEKTKRWIESIRQYASQNDYKLQDLRFIDIGANVGWFTLVMASIGLNVIAVEPLAENLRLLRQSLCLEKNKDLAENVVLHGKGVSKSAEWCVMYSHNANIGDGLMHCEPTKEALATFIPMAGYFIRGDPIEVVQLDDLIDTSSPGSKPIVAIKMDTEGHEGRVLEGGRQTLVKSHVPLIFSEFNAAWIASWGGGDPLQFMRSFVEEGYSVRREGTPKGTALDRDYLMDMKNWQGLNDIILEYNASSIRQE